jgi:pyrimidine-nucleoside phosphorylase
MVEIGRLSGRKMTAILTGMDEPLGHKIGNGLEVYEAIETLHGHGPKDLVDVTIEIGAHLLGDANIETDFDKAKSLLRNALKDGSAFNKFVEVVKAQGGDTTILYQPEQLLSKKIEEVHANQSGYVEDINALEIGKAAMRLGAGRETKEDQIYMEVGIDLHKKIGSKVEKGDVLATLFVRDKGINEAKNLITNAIKIGPTKKEVVLIKQTIK